jgi:hypothetical protein
MTDKKLTDVTDNNVGKITDEEIKKALECCCENNVCNECPLDYLTFSSECASKLSINALDLINRQKAEIERLTTLAELGNKRANDYRVMRDRAVKAEKEIERLMQIIEDKGGLILIEYAKSEAYKEFAERLKIIMRDRYLNSDMRYSMFVTPEDIDNLLKEMVGEDNEDN